MSFRAFAAHITLDMVNSEPAFPFFMSTEERSLTPVERDVIATIVSAEAPAFVNQIENLRVVGRCGCGNCPTIFFQFHDANDREQKIASYVGKDATGGLVGVLLWEKHDRLSQLEFYSLDGHDPWHIPELGSLGRF